MEQRIKTPIEIEKDKDLEWDFDDHSISNHSELEEDPYLITKEEMDARIERANKDIEEGKTILYDEKFKKRLRWIIDNMEEGVPFNKTIPQELL